MKYRLKSPPSKKRPLKILSVVIVVALILALLVGLLIIRRNNAMKREADLKSQSEAQTNSAKKDTENSIEATANSDGRDPSTTDQVPVSTSLSVQISDVKQVDHMVSASAMVLGGSEGTCVFTYTNPDDKPVVQQVASTNSGCKSSVSDVQFSKLGAWNLNVTFYANNSRGEANQSVEIN